MGFIDDAIGLKFVITLLWLYFLAMEVVHFFGHYRRDWVWEYFASFHTYYKWSHVGLLLWFVIWLWIPQMEEGLHRATPLLALLGWIHWLRLLSLCTGFRTLRLGRLLLPVLVTLTQVQVLAFFLIMSVFSLAHVQATYTMSGDNYNLDYLLFAAYRLGLLTDFESGDDILFQGEGETAEGWQVGVQYAVFVIGSLLLAVAMKNIFIGIMSNGFDANVDKVDRLIIGRRAWIGLNYTLRAEIFGKLCPDLARRPGLVWFCHVHEVVSDVAPTVPQALDDGASLHVAIRQSTDGIWRKVSCLDKRVDKMQRSMDRLASALSAASQSPMPGTQAPHWLQQFVGLGSRREL